MSTYRTAERSTQSKRNGFLLRQSATVPRPPVHPVNITAVIGQIATTGSLIIEWPRDIEADDLAILVHETSGNSETIGAPTGFTAFPGSPVVDLATAGGSKLSVFWKWATGNDADVVTPGVADHSVARLYALRGVRRDVDPGRAITTATKTTASTSITFPSIDTVAHNSRIAYIVGYSADVAMSFSGFTNANLTTLFLSGSAVTTNGNGGGFMMQLGVLAEPGATGTATATWSTSTTNTMMVLALEPSVALPA
jgi:hypothetical protein